MSAQKIYDKLIMPEAKYWLKELEYYGENQFKKKTEASDWTIGQVYAHVSNDMLNDYIKTIGNCLDNPGADSKGGKTFKGFLVFLLNNMFGKYKTADSYTPAQPENLVKARDMIYRFLKETQRLASMLDKAGETTGKIKHPHFGFLTATEWYRLCYMHMSHHRAQKYRIDEILRRSPKEAFGEDL